MLPRSQWIFLTAIAGAAVLGMVGPRVNAYALDILLNIGINIILAVSLNLINGFTGQFSLGHAGFMSVGAYAAAAFTTLAGPHLLPVLGGQTWLLFLIALVLSGLAAALAGFVVGLPSLRLRGDYLAIVTLGFGEMIKVIVLNIPSIGGALGMPGIPGYTNLFWVYSTAALCVYVVWALVNSSYGRGFLAVADDEVAASAMGLNPTRYKISAFVVGAVFAGIAGGLWAHFKQFIEPKGFDFNRSIEIVGMVILGGMARHVGVILAAILLTIILEQLRPLGEYRMILYAISLIALMLLRPQGLFTWTPFRKPSSRPDSSTTTA